MKLIALLIPLLILLACSTPVIPTPQPGTVLIECPGEQEVRVNDIFIGYTPVETWIIENYPNYLQVGVYKALLWPPCTYAKIEITPDEHPTEYTEDQLLMEWKEP